MFNANHQKAIDVAKKYIGGDVILKDLGSGIEGFVFASPSDTAIKVFQSKDKFEHELAAYQRLAAHGVIDICGLAVPRLIKFDSDLLVIEMTIVQPPYLLDFAQSRLDRPISFDETEEEMWERLSEIFGSRLADAQHVCAILQLKYGIYYYDIAPRNINFGDPAEPDS